MPSAPSAAAEVQRAKKQPRAAPGRAADATVTSVHPLFVIATLANGASACFCPRRTASCMSDCGCLRAWKHFRLSAGGSPCAETRCRLFLRRSC